MKRDLELMQDILIRIESAESEMKTSHIVVPEHTEKEIAEHVCLLIESGYIASAINVTTMSTDYPVYVVKGLTLSGHDYLAELQSSKAWSWVKLKISDAISISSVFKLIRSLFGFD